jgi:hypothetical protein
MGRDKCELKRVIVTMKPVVIEVPEEWTDEQISAALDEGSPGLWSSWTYEESWR